jgi:hypothetical protein
MVRFVNIGGIVDHHWLKFLFIINSFLDIEQLLTKRTILCSCEPWLNFCYKLNPLTNGYVSFG